MCGIVYAHSFDGTPVNEIIFDQYESQRSRGIDGFGLFDGQDMSLVREVKEDNIIKWLAKYESNLIMFHHRYPTSTINVKRAAHPFSTRKYFGNVQYIMVHNGNIGNAKILKKKHKKLGIKYQSILQDGTFVDSEALLWDLALTLEGKQEELEVYGAIAFVCMRIIDGKLDKMFFGRNHARPLNMFRSPHGIELSSEGIGDEVEPNMLNTFSYEHNRLTRKSMDFNFSRPYVPSTTPTAPLLIEAEVSRRGQAGDWLPQYLRDKYRKVIETLKDQPRLGDDREVLYYDGDGRPIYQSDMTCGQQVFSSYDEYVQERRMRDTRLLVGELSEEKQEESEMIHVPHDKVEQRAFEYLLLSKGNFEDAYFLAERDYETMFDVPEEDQNMQYLAEVRMQEAILSEINGDPEYIDETSVSSMWLPLSQQMELIDA